MNVDKLIFPVDFLVLDMEEDREIPIILGRPFLATGRTLIDVQQGLLTFRVNDEEVVFNVFEATKFPSETEECFQCDILDEIVFEEFQKEYPLDYVESCIVNLATIHYEN